MRGKSIEELKVGDSEYFEKTITEADIYLFAGITGDFSEVHINEVASAKTMFGGRIAHCILAAGLISATIGTRLPGSGTIYLEQKLRFLKPVRPQDTVRAAVEIVEIINERNRVRLKTTCTNQKGEVVLDGEALIMPPRA